MDRILYALVEAVTVISGLIVFGGVAFFFLVI